MRKSEEYRVHAAECQRMADATVNQDDRRAWLQMAESWLRMAGQADLIGRSDQTASEKFDATEKQIGTHQDKSDSSH